MTTMKLLARTASALGRAALEFRSIRLTRQTSNDGTAASETL